MMQTHAFAFQLLRSTAGLLCVSATLAACAGDSTPTPPTPTESFALSTVGGVSTGALAEAHTCDGTSLSPPVSWTAGPSNTATYVLIMSTVPVSGPTKYNWLLYNIPSGTTSLAADAKTVGTFGNADDGGGLAYAPPCSPSTGTKNYTFTLYALSGTPNLSAFTASQVTGAVLAAAIAPITIASSSLTLSVTRTQAAISCAYVKTSIVPYATTNSLSVTCDGTHALLSTFGIQTKHSMMNGITGTNLQVPIAQNFTGTNAWKLPLIPSVASTKTTANDGPIGVAVNGVPIFNPCKQGGCDPATGGGDTKVLGELDLCNGHAGRADDYHYHAAPVCMMADQPANYWNTHPLGWALDGYGIFGYFNPDGSTATRDNVCGGNTLAHSNAPEGYAYHVTDVSPYILSCFYGTPSPDLAGQASKYAPIRPPADQTNGGPGVSNMTLDATATTLAIGGTTTLQWTKSGVTYQIQYKRTTSLCWNFIFKTGGTQTSTADYCRSQ